MTDMPVIVVDSEQFGDGEGAGRQNNHSVDGPIQLFVKILAAQNWSRGGVEGGTTSAGAANNITSPSALEGKSTDLASSAVTAVFSLGNTKSNHPVLLVSGVAALHGDYIKIVGGSRRGDNGVRSPKPRVGKGNEMGSGGDFMDGPEDWQNPLRGDAVNGSHDSEQHYEAFFPERRTNEPPPFFLCSDGRPTVRLVDLPFPIAHEIMNQICIFISLFINTTRHAGIIDQEAAVWMNSFWSWMTHLIHHSRPQIHSPVNFLSYLVLLIFFYYYF